MAQGPTLATGATDVELVSLGLQDASRQDQQAALYNSTCVHASFGDLELAQMTLRGGVIALEVPF